MAEFRIIVDGRPVEGWQTIRVSRSLDEIAHSWEVSVASRRDGVGQATEIELFSEGATAVIEIDSRPVINGYVDRVRRSADARSRSLSLAGRSRAGDLVDCSVIGKHSWQDVHPIDIANDLTSFFGIVASTKLTLDTVARFRSKAGEEVFTTLDRLARQLGARWISTADGHIELMRTGLKFAEAPLVRGVNIFAIDLTLDGSQRFSDYVFRSQLATSDKVFGNDAANVEVAVLDPGMSRNRPLVIQHDQGGVDVLRRRAEWERNTRAGRTVVLRLTVVDAAAPERSWYSGTRLWEPGELVTVSDDVEELSGQWLIAGVELTYGQEGTRAELELVGPKAYDPEPLPVKRKKGSSLW